jgi:hypothetical protein
VSVGVPEQRNVAANVSIGFRARGHMPKGGYYYAVIVLEKYPHYSSEKPPQCAVSSDMEKTEYGYPHRGRTVRLTLIPVKSPANHWCSGGTYAGAIYAVPHKPPCCRHYPCYGKSALSGSCWELEGGRVACGVVALPKEEQAAREAKEKAELQAKEKAEREAKQPAEPQAREKAEREARERAEREASERAVYSYPGGLPKPIDPSTRIVARFEVKFVSPGG